MKKLIKVMSSLMLCSSFLVYTSPSKASTNNQGDFVVISNEKVVVNGSSQSTGSLNFNQSTARMTTAYNLESDEPYKIDVIKPFDPDSVTEKKVNKNARMASMVPVTYNVGDESSFWVSNYQTGVDYQLSAQLKYSGDVANVWVPIDEQYINDNDAIQIGEEFDNKIYSLITNNFGNESDVNNDGKINILCYDIKDGFNGTNGYVAGYFNPEDLYSTDQKPHSNYSEIFYIDTYPLISYKGEKNLIEAFSTLAHEFQHMVNYNENVLIENGEQMDTWLNEALSLAAEQMYLNDVLEARINFYNNNSSIVNGHSLLRWGENGNSLPNYSLSYLFAQYIKAQAGRGDSIFKEIIDSEYADYRAVEEIIQRDIAPSLTFSQMLTNFRIALLLNQSTGLYGFKGEPGFESINPRIYTGTTSKTLSAGGAIVVNNNARIFKEPINKGKDITYTFIHNGEIVSGDLNSNDITDKEKTITGTTNPNATVYVKDGSTTLASGTANADGSFEVNLSKEPVGIDTLTVKADFQFNTATYTKETTINVEDKTPPEKPTVNEVGDNVTSVTGKTEKYAKVYVKARGNLLGSNSANSTGNFTVSIPKQSVNTQLTVYVEDLAGHTSEEVKVTVVDKTPPNAPTVNAVSDFSTTVTGKAEANATVYVNVGTTQIGSSKASATGDYSITIPKQKAYSKITVYAEDAAKNRSRETSVTVADKTAPAKPTVNAVGDNATSVTGKAEASATVYVKIGTSNPLVGTASSTGDFKITIPKQKAGTKIYVYAVDKAGNNSGETSTTVVDKTPPVRPTVSAITDKMTTITGKTEAGANVFVYVGIKQIGKGTATTNGTFSIAIPKQIAGKVVTVVAYDKVGNKSAETKVTVLDRTPPATLTVNTVGDNTTKVTGKTEAYATVYVKVGTKVIGKATATSKGAYTVTISTKQKAGTTLTIEAVDKAGNKRIVKKTVVDKTSPAAPKVNNVTKITTYVKGTAEKGATIQIYRGSKLIGKGTVTSKGTFSVKIAKQKKGTVLKVYAIDKAKNRSAARSVTVK